jgi:hypothetical protein
MGNTFIRDKIRKLYETAKKQKYEYEFEELFKRIVASDDNCLYVWMWK